jgi:nucleotide-binding universal stress UspA family protein
MFSTIVVGTDGSTTAYRAVRKATEIARLCSASLHLVTAYHPQHDMAVVGPMGMALGLQRSDDEVRADIEGMLESVAKDVTAEGVTVHVHATPGRAADVILDVAEREQADLIVVGNRGVQGSRPFLGSVPFNLLHHARCAVLVVHTTTAAEQETGPL